MLTAVAALVAYACFSFAISHWWRPPAAIGDELMQRLRTSLALMLLFRFGIEAWAYSLSTPEGRPPPAGFSVDELRNITGEGGSDGGGGHDPGGKMRPYNPFNGAFPWGRIVTNCVLLLAYACFPMDMFTKYFRRYRHDELEAYAEGVRYDEVRTLAEGSAAPAAPAAEASRSLSSFFSSSAAARPATKARMHAYECPALSKARGRDAATLIRRRELEQATWILAADAPAWAQTKPQDVELDVFQGRRIETRKRTRH